MIAIAFASFKETLRKRIFLLVGILTLIYLILFGLIIHYSIKDMADWKAQNSTGVYIMVSQIVSMLGFYFSSMLVAFLTIMASVGSVSSEIESGVIHSIITRPIKRTEYILGKYLGLGILVTAYSILLYASVFLVCYILKMPVIAATSLTNILNGLGYFILQPVAILSLSVWGSARFKTLTNGIVVIGIYILGLIGGFMEQIGSALNKPDLVNWGIFSSLISPFDVIYRKLTSTIFPSRGSAGILMPTEALTSVAPSKWMMVYIFIYIVGLMYLSIRQFSKRDIG